MKGVQIIVFALILFCAPAVVAASPASLSFDLIDQSTKTGQTVSVAVNIYTNNQAVASTDVWIKYDPSIVKPVTSSIIKGSLFENVEAKIVSPGKLYLYGVRTNPSVSTPLLGTVATIKFNALREGKTDLRFECSQYKKQSSTIIKSDSSLTNIISCESTIAHSTQITVKGGAILGVNTNHLPISPIYLAVGAVVLIITCLLYYRYRSIASSL